MLTISGMNIRESERKKKEIILRTICFLIKNKYLLYSHIQNIIKKERKEI